MIFAGGSVLGFYDTPPVICSYLANASPLREGAKAIIKIVVEKSAIYAILILYGGKYGF